MKNYKLIRSMIDEAFADMRMTAENLALRDEMMANAQDRYEDALAQGKTEAEAAEEVMASLGDVKGLLEQMNAAGTQGDERAEDAAAGAAQDETETETETEAEAKTATEEAQQASEAAQGGDLGDALGKAFGALGELGRAFVPQTKRLMRDVDKATGGVVGDIGRAVNKGMRDAQKAAGEVIDRMSGEAGELVFDFGDRKQPPQEKTPEQMRSEAADLRAQAEIKQAVDDQEGARALRAQAYALETQAEAIEQAEAMRAAQAEAAGRETAEAFKQAVSDMESAAGDAAKAAEEAFERAVDEIESDAHEAAQEADYTVRGEGEKLTGHERFDPAGLHGIDIQCDAVNVTIEPSQTGMVEVVWSVSGDEAPTVKMEGHKLIVRRRSADALKSLFSIFQRDGGTITVYVPRGYGCRYKIGTRSGEISLRGIDCDKVKANSTSGSVHIEPDARTRAEQIDASTVSGSVTVSACAEDIKAQTVSGRVFVSCDAKDVEVDSVSGAVHVEGACESCDVDGVSGDVELLFTVPPTRKVEINTVSASARVALPGDIRGFVAEIKGLMGAAGGIVNEFGPNRYGTCALPIKMDTVSGKLMVTRL